MEVDFKLKHQADVFRERLESLLKKFPPEQYAVTVSNFLDTVSENEKLWSSYPPHSLLHSIQSNCIYYNKNRSETLSVKRLNQIMKLYKEYYDPIAQYYLIDNNNNGLIPFFVNMARQQFFIQHSFGANEIGRALELINHKKYPKSEQFFINQFGLSFNDWFLVGLGIYTGIFSKKPMIISQSFLTNSEISAYKDKDSNVNAFFNLNSLSPSDVREYHNNISLKVNANMALFYDTYLNGVFVEKPLLRLNDEHYLVVHKQLLLQKIIEGIFDICKKEIPSEWGVEFGESFERYIEKLLLQFIPQYQIFTERDMRRFTDKKICDFLIVMDDYILLLESKAVEFSAYIASENAMRGDNSTRKISAGFEQLYSVATLLKEGAFQDLIGDCNNKKIIASVITYRQLYLANTSWYYNEVIHPAIKHKDTINEDLFAYKPQILSIRELESLLKYCEMNQLTYYQIFEEKLEQDDHKTGDWHSYLKIDSNIPFLKKTFDDFLASVFFK